MRIIGGKAKGRRLATPRSDDVIRPTADRVRQVIFDVLGQQFDGVGVLDLFCGTGAMALEALSRGARRAVLVDVEPLAVGLARRNAVEAGFGDQVEIVTARWEEGVERLRRSGQAFELVFSDPPYRLEAAQAVLEAIQEIGAGGSILCPGATVVVEHGRREGVPEQVGRLARIDQRRFGDTTVTIFRLTGSAS